MSKQSEYRAVSRIDKTVYDRLQKASEATGISTSDLVRLSLVRSLNEIEGGRFTVSSMTKKAA